MTKIVYIGNKLSKKGKTETSIESLSKKLRTEGFDIITASDKSNKILRMLDMVITIVMNAKRTDYVLIDTYSTWNFYYALIVSKICMIFNLKYVPILRGGNLPSRLKHNKRFCSTIFNHAYKNVAPSRYLETQFRSHGYNNVACIPNTIDISRYDFSQKSFNKPKLLWVRSFSRIYNPEMALKVVHKLMELNLDYELCMVGPDVDGTLHEIKNQIEDLDLKVVLKGKLSKQEWRELSKNYNLFINTTDFDNMPVSVIEAMALGLPIISTDVGGIPYLLEHKKDGILVQPNDIEDMAKQIVNLCQNPNEAKELAYMARKKAEGFDWQVVKHYWLDLLE